MNTEQQLQVEQIKRRVQYTIRGNCGCQVCDWCIARSDIQVLLSLVKSQEAPSGKDDDLARFVLRCIRGCATDDQYIETLERIKTAFVSVRDDASTSMRSACIEKVKEYRLKCEQTGVDLSEKEDESSQRMYWRADGAADALEIVERELESVSIQE